MKLNPRPNEIYEARVRLGKADYPRPCVIMGLEREGKVSALLITSALELCDNSHFNFRIDANDPDFPKTGLKKDCCIMGERFVNIDCSDLIRKRGQFDGELLNRFLKWIT